MTRTLESFGTFWYDTVLAASCIYRLLPGLLTVSRFFDEVSDPTCSQIQNDVSKLNLCVCVYIDIYTSMTRE